MSCSTFWISLPQLSPAPPDLSSASLQIYLVAYTAIGALVALWVLPGAHRRADPHPLWRDLGATCDALITAFTAGDLFIVLPAQIQACGQILRRHLPSDGAETLPDAIVPAFFNFPHAGKLLSLSFILFAGWFSDAAVSFTAYPKLALTGFLSFFGSLNAAVPFLLNTFRIPADTFQFFLATGVVNSRVGTLVAAIHIVSVGLLGSAAVAGALRLTPSRIIRYLLVTLCLSVLTVAGLRALFATLLKPKFDGAEIVYSMASLYPHPPSTVIARDAVSTQPVLQSIRNRGVLRVGFMEDRLTFTFRDRHGELAGLDIEMAHRLARNLQVQVEFVSLQFADLPAALSQGECDIVMSGTPVTPLRLLNTLFSEPYLDETLAFLVPDYARDSMPAERGSVLTLLKPELSIVVPQPDTVKIPLAYPLAHRDLEWASFINTWIALKRHDGTLDALYQHWILGQDAKPPAPRWSILRNVLHWAN